MIKMKHKSILGVSLLALTLAGCSVTPEPLTRAEHEDRVEEDMGNLYSDQEKIAAPINMYEAMARALKYNMDNRLKMMEEVLSSQQLTVAKMGLLPQLTANAGYSGRSEPDASNSQNLDTHVKSSSYSFSDDTDNLTADLGLSWNILDFGLSYIRAEQVADRYMISKERRRKVVHNIVQDVRNAYWRALSAQRLLAKIGPLQEKITKALESSRAISDARLRPALETLQYRRNLLEALRELKVLRRELVSSKIELATLMNVAPGTEYQLQDDGGQFVVPEVKIDLKELENLALVNRPELREEAYQKRISAKDVTRAMVGLIPGLELEYKANYDSNSFNYSNSWTNWGASISYNLLKSFTEGPAVIKQAEDQLKVVETRRLALYMAVLSQVHIAYTDYKQVKDEFSTTADLYKVSSGILRETENAAQTQTQDDLKMIEAQLDNLLAELRRDVNYADMLNAAGRIFVSVGADPLPDTVKDHSIETLSKALQARLQGWYAGKVNPQVQPAVKMSEKKVNEDKAPAQVHADLPKVEFKEPMTTSFAQPTDRQFVRKAKANVVQTPNIRVNDTANVQLNAPSDTQFVKVSAPKPAVKAPTYQVATPQYVQPSPVSYVEPTKAPAVEMGNAQDKPAIRPHDVNGWLQWFKS